MSPIETDTEVSTHSRSQLLDSFHIAGFIYYDGASAFHELTIGTRLTLKREQANTYDANAIAIYQREHKLGFIPRDLARSLAKFMDAGYDIFNVIVQQVSPEEHPAQQIRVGIFVRSQTSTTIECNTPKAIEGATP